MLVLAMQFSKGAWSRTLVGAVPGRVGSMRIRRRSLNAWSRLEAFGAVIATKSECGALPQNGTENDEPESFKSSEN